MTSLYVRFEWIITHICVLCFTIILDFASDSSFHFTSYSFLIATCSGFDTLFASSLHISLSVRFSSLSHYCYHIWLGILRSMAHEIFFMHVAFYTWRHGFFIIGYFGPVSLHFYHPITLAYVTSCVLRPPWGYEIRCHLRQPLLGQVFEIWLIFRYYHVSSSGRHLSDV